MTLPKLFTLIFVVFFLFISSNAQAQDSSINITVKNQLSELIPEAEILLFKDGKQIKTLKPNRQGVARFNNLADGEYLIAVTATGFNDFKSELFSVKNGETKSIEAILEVKPIESNVSVGGDDDVENSGTSRVLNENQIQRLPDDPAKLEKLLRSIAGESATGEQMPITVDGQEGAKLPPKEQIQAIRINQNVFSAQYDNPNGWGIEIYTRSNVDKF
ncbi:MAG: carboxypeptidase regulatory-like domain-containing protein, partial [Blastocatellia bacterium]|nr:carboxypeptidase regulatory-like domain-containing protein [Blastocatellia bacterium]